jgi:pimeloyl-ACP methyl ester carboxylesterase
MLEVGGLQRNFIVHVPEGYTGTTRVPLVLDFHALGGSGSQEQSSSGYQRIADQEGFLIAFADGIDNAWNIGPCCTNSRDVDDLGFAKAMVESIAADGCVDPKRVYAVGFSMGGGMSHYLACQAADVFAAVVPAAFDLLEPEEQDCEPARPISVLSFRSTNDIIVPYEGGPSNPPNGLPITIHFEGAEGTLERWFTPEFRAEHPDKVDRIRQMLLSADPGGYAACAAAIRDMDQREEIGAITASTLVIAGSRDPATTPAHAEFIASKIAGSKLVTLDCQHLSNVERADEFNATLLEFLAADSVPVPSA